MFETLVKSHGKKETCEAFRIKPEATMKLNVSL
jgi:hypothetical protein